ncbi:MAG: anaerobic ribonucleoside-triphosphate reductase activating protein [Candidatus Omnitrophota bacterium]
MMIAGLQKLSLVDYPGHLSTVVFLQGCNFNCGYCQNPDLIRSEKQFDFSKKNFFDFIQRRKGTIEGVVISGGEPTIHNDLPEFIEKIKKLNFKIKLDTNGSNPEQLEFLLRSRMLDYVAMDIKTSFSRYSLVSSQKEIATKVLESIRLLLFSTISYEFRTTCVPTVVDDADFIEIGKKVKKAQRYCLQQFRPMVVNDEVFSKITPYSNEKIYGFRNILEEFVEKVDIRGLVGDTGNVPFKETRET